VFPKGIKITNLRSGDSTLAFQVLSLEADAGEGKNLVAHPEAGVAVDNNVGMQATTRPQDDSLANDAVRANLALWANLCARMNDSGGMYFESVGAHASTSMKATSASLTTSPRTVQTPRALPILPRALCNPTLMIKVSP